MHNLLIAGALPWFLQWAGVAAILWAFSSTSPRALVRRARVPDSFNVYTGISLVGWSYREILGKVVLGGDDGRGDRIHSSVVWSDRFVVRLRRPADRPNYFAKGRWYSTGGGFWSRWPRPRLSWRICCSSGDSLVWADEALRCGICCDLWPACSCSSCRLLSAWGPILERLIVTHRASLILTDYESPVHSSSAGIHSADGSLFSTT